MTCSLFSVPTDVNFSATEFENLSQDPIKIAKIEIYRIKKGRVSIPFIYNRGPEELYIIRSQSTQGAVGFSVAHERIKHFFPILQQLIIPYFIGKDIRRLAALIDEVYVFRSNYKLSGLALWCCVAWVEMSLLDLLGKQTQRSISQLLGGTEKIDIPIYLSSLRRDTTPEEEIEWLGQRLAETGAQAVKFKIGGRMSRDADAMPQRTQNLIRQARQAWGDKIAIGVDGNGSFGVKKAVEIGNFLEAHEAAFFEEPCPFDDFEATSEVTRALALTIAGGEQETSHARFKYMMEKRVVNVLQPDLVYNGGFIRTLRVIQMAAKYQVPVTIHNARLGFNPLYMIQFAAFLPGNYQEYNARPDPTPTWFTPVPKVSEGRLRLPPGPGFGVRIDPTLLRKAQRLSLPRI